LKSHLYLLSLSAHPLLLFFCVAKRKVTKEKATFFEMLRTKKGAIRCVRKALFSSMALVFLPIAYCYLVKE